MLLGGGWSEAEGGCDCRDNRDRGEEGPRSLLLTRASWCSSSTFMIDLRSAMIRVPQRGIMRGKGVSSREAEQGVCVVPH